MMQREHNEALYPTVRAVQPVDAQLAADACASFQVVHGCSERDSRCKNYFISLL